MVKLNDAVLVTNDDEEDWWREISRVIAVANGLAVVQPIGNSEDHLWKEPNPGEWPVVGQFILVRRWWFWNRWQFVPSEK